MVEKYRQLDNQTLGIGEVDEEDVGVDVEEEDQTNYIDDPGFIDKLSQFILSGFSLRSWMASGQGFEDNPSQTNYIDEDDLQNNEIRDYGNQYENESDTEEDYEGEW